MPVQKQSNKQTVTIVIAHPPAPRRRRRRKPLSARPPSVRPPPYLGNTSVVSYPPNGFAINDAVRARSEFLTTTNTLKAAVDQGATPSFVRESTPIKQEQAAVVKQEAVAVKQEAGVLSPLITPEKVEYAPESRLVQMGAIYNKHSIPGAHARSLLGGYPGGATGFSPPGLVWIPPEAPAVATNFTVRNGVLRCALCETDPARDISKEHRCAPIHRTAFMALRASDIIDKNAQARAAYAREMKDIGSGI
jgi:hypothetical protein